MSTSKKTGRGRKKKVSCKKCGFGETVSDFGEPNKTWNLVSPMPDKDGNVTLTVMGSFRCPKCGKGLTTAIQKIKGDQFGGGKSKKELLIEVASSQTEATSLDDLAGQVGLGAQSVEKAVALLIKKGDLKGKIVDGAYVP
ncbi:MAG: hypothetical protein ACFFGZ_14440 [Candidatus Thorarchaeota archaeon]